MGKLTAHRNFLFQTLPDAFHRQLGQGRHFSVLIMDLMQFIAKVKFDEADDHVNPSELARSARRVVEQYMNGEQEPLRPHITDLTVVLLDTPAYVPKNKTATQKKRDTVTSAATSAQVDERCDENVLNEADYNRFVELYDIEAMHHLIVSENFICPFSGNMVWRSCNLRLQLYRTLTHELLSIELAAGRQLILDDGVEIEEEVFLQQREQMIRDYGFGDRRPFEKECLVTSLMSKWFTQRFRLHSKGLFERFPCTGTGEADVKLCRYISLDERHRSFLVVSQDTDVIFILLLHMKRLVNRETGQIDPDVEVWLDTQTPMSRNAGQSYDYRYIDMVTLYNSLLALFQREYPSVSAPIETYVFLVQALETDFTANFDSYLRITPARLWDTFSTLHSERVDGTHLVFEEKKEKTVKLPPSPLKKRRLEPKKEAIKLEEHMPREMRFCLSDAIQSFEAYDETTGDLFYESRMDTSRLSDFFYLLCQQRLKSDLLQMGNARLLSDPAYRLPTEIIFVSTREIEERVRALKLSCDERQSQATMCLPNLSTNHANVPFKRPILQKRVINEMPKKDVEMESIEDDEEEDVLAEVRKKHVVMLPSNVMKSQRLKTLAQAKTPLPVNYGIPEQAEMLARIQRQHWLLRYSQNGWIDEKYALNFGDSSPLDPTLSLWGWRLCEVPQERQTFSRGEMNSSFLLHRHFAYECGEQMVPVKLYSVEESNRIFRV